MAESMMARGAREANEESARLAVAEKIGTAAGNLAAILNQLVSRVEALEKKLDSLLAKKRTPAINDAAKEALRKALDAHDAAVERCCHDSKWTTTVQAVVSAADALLAEKGKP